MGTKLKTFTKGGFHWTGVEFIGSNGEQKQELLYKSAVVGHCFRDGQRIHPNR